MSNKIRYISAIQAANKGAAIRVLKYFNKHPDELMEFVEYCQCKIRVTTYESDIKDGEKLFKREEDGIKNLVHFDTIVRYGSGDDLNYIVKSLAQARKKDDITAKNFRSLLPKYIHDMDILSIIAKEVQECLNTAEANPELVN